ncbi:O-antigen ligase family protein [Marinobacter aromaticivorans]|uniref:O-antigen ligase family protein n=1 Tax=Marinobacter aromaticivorans TaxID=1494078 RepID=A0ABW2ISW6_9GAMM|nr:O-antigen ligase family protein [Marinobacter aromaticivorans]
MIISKTFNPEKVFFSVFIVYYVFRFLFPAVNGLGVGTLIFGLCIYWVSVSFRYIETRMLFPAHILFLFLFCFWAITLTFFATSFSLATVIFFVYLLAFSYAAYFLSKLGAYNFVAKILLLFLGFQLFVVLGQAAKIHTGLGFDVPASSIEGIDKSYFLMTPGTFFNKNDLSAVSALSFVYFLIFGHYLGFDKKVTLGLFFSVILVLITTSRSSLLLLVLLVFIYLLFKKRRLSILLVPALISIFFGIWLILFEYREEVVLLDIIVTKIETISEIVKGGASSSNSVSIRLYSYFNFIENIGILGFGSGDLKSYGAYIPGDAPYRGMLASVPHSLVVELGYWGGWPLLILFFISILSFKMLWSLMFFIYVVAFLGLSFVSSSVIGNFAFFWVFFNGFHLCLDKSILRPKTQKAQ